MGSWVSQRREYCAKLEKKGVEQNVREDNRIRFPNALASAKAIQDCMETRVLQWKTTNDTVECCKGIAMKRNGRDVTTDYRMDTRKLMG